MWFPIALISYFLFAAVKLTDKYLLKSSLPVPLAYAFYVGIFSLLGSALILAISPLVLGFPFPSGIFSVVALLARVNWLMILIAILSGVLFIWALIGFYSGVRVGEASRVVPAIGAGVAIFTLFFAQLFLNEGLDADELLAFFLLFLGGILISIRISKKEFLHLNKEEGIYILFASVLFALSWVLKKLVFLHHDFIIGFLWTNLGVTIGVFPLLVSAYARKEIFSRPAKIAPKNKIIFLSNQVAGGTASILQNLAVALGSVTLVNGLQGMENLFLLGLAFFLAIKFPRLLKEEFHGFVVWQKLFAVVLIGFGFAILSIKIF